MSGESKKSVNGVEELGDASNSLSDTPKRIISACPHCGQQVEVYFHTRFNLEKPRVVWEETLTEREKAVLEEAEESRLLEALGAAIADTKMTPPKVLPRFFLEGINRMRKMLLPRSCISVLVETQADALWLGWWFEGLVLLVKVKNSESSVTHIIPGWVIEQGNEGDFERAIKNKAFQVDDANWDFMRGARK